MSKSSNNLDEWVSRHSDAWHHGSREDCAHCQEMIRLYGEMPTADAIHKRDAELKRNSRYQKAIIPDNLRWQVWERDNFTCKCCGSRRDLALDHIVPESKGGKTVAENLQTLCRRCNSKKGSRQ